MEKANSLRSRHSSSSPNETKGPGYGYDYELEQTRVRGIETDPQTSLHRGLKARHISMIAIGGAIGTGLIIGTGKALAQAGPGSILISYSLIGFIVFLVMAGLGEISAWLPMSAGFTGYASRFCDPSLGFALGWVYWFKYIILPPNQLTALALVIQFWLPPERVNPGVWIAIFLVLILCINYFGVRFFGEFEFWLSSFKVVVIIGIIILSLIITAGGVDGEVRGFKYWRDPGAFNEYLVEGPLGKFLGFYSTLVTATFAFLGTELVGVTVGEAQNPRRTIPRAIKLTFWRIVVFYIVSIFLLGMIVRYDDDKLSFNLKKNLPGANSSPFVVAIEAAGIDILPHIINGAILLFVFSAANSDLYIASRTLYGLASDGSAPSFFRRTDSRGVPIYALFLSASFGLLGLLNVSDSAKTVFTYFVNVTTILGLLTWISILVTHISFVRARKAQGITDDQMPYTAPLGIYGSYGALFTCCLIAITKNFDAFIPSITKKEKYTAFITGYIGIPIYLILIFGHKWWTKSKRVRPHECDFYTGKDIIDREEEEFLANQAAERAANPDRGRTFYRKWVSWLF
ncbi:amino acid permease [Poronia punctata]|nr:amino acid permease [Poronia punctata]